VIYALYGALGAVLVLLLFGLGVFAGYKIRVKIEAHEASKLPPPATPEEEERRRLIEDNKAFRTLANYNADMAYGHTVADQFLVEDGEV
jgi:hypothetical protein